MQLKDTTVGGDVRVTFGDLSVYEAQGRDEYLSRGAAASDSRIERRRAGAGLDQTQIARIKHLLPPVPDELSTFATGRLIVLTGPLGAGKSDIAEAWLRSAIISAQANPDAPVPVWIAIDELESSLELHVRKELGLIVLENLGAEIVVDGLDQRADRAEKIIRQASSLTERWPRSRVVLTSRATHGVSGDNVLEVEPLSKARGRQLVSLIAGVAYVGNISDQIEESLERPLFALLIGQQSTIDHLTTMTEVIEGVVRKIVGSENKDLYPHLRRLAVETISNGRAVDPESFTDFDVAAQIRDSPFLTTTTHGVSFSLATLEQWFAARALLEGAVEVSEVIVDLVSFDRWKYVLSMVLASGEPGRVDPIMATIARWNPGAIAWIINETESAGLARSQRDVPEDGQSEIAARLRFAVSALLNGLGPLAAAFRPLRVNGVNSLEDLSLSVEAWGSSVRTTWSAGGSMFMQTAAAPLSRNWVWTTARNILANDLSNSFTTLAITIAVQSDGVVRRELEDCLRRDAEYPSSVEDIGRKLYGSLYPLPDIPPGPSGWPEFSVQAMTDRINDVIHATMECYKELCAAVAPNFGDTLAHLGLMPFVYYGNILYSPSVDRGPFGAGPSEAWLQWLFRPSGVALPNGQRSGENSVDITVNDDSRKQEIDDNYSIFGDDYLLYVASMPGIEPFADSFSVSTGRFSLIDKKPATHLALGWLWEDLRNLKWASGPLPSDQTE